MIDLKDLYTSGESSMTIDEIVDAILGKKSGYIKGLGYGPKPNTNRATQRRTTELEDSLRKTKEEAASVQLGLQKRLDAAEVVVENQQSQIETLTSQLDTLSARQDDIMKQLQHFMSLSRSRLEFSFVVSWSYSWHFPFVELEYTFNFIKICERTGSRCFIHEMSPIYRFLAPNFVSFS